jgi:hypothetical protein
MQSAGHEIVHQIVAAGNRVENVGDATGLVGFGNLSETKVSLIGCVHGWHPSNRPVRKRTFFKAGTHAKRGRIRKTGSVFRTPRNVVILNYGDPSRQTPACALIAGIRCQETGDSEQETEEVSVGLSDASDRRGKVGGAGFYLLSRREAPMILCSLFPVYCLLISGRAREFLDFRV